MIDLYVLGSKSPDRKELMEKAGLVPFIVLPGDYDESDQASDPVRRAEMLARKKGENVLGKLERTVKDPEFMASRGITGKKDAVVVLLTADTIVSFKSETFGKAANDFEAFATVSTLQGQTHKLVTGYHVQVLSVDLASGTITGTGSTTGHSVTKVKFAPMTQSEIRGYILTDEWRGRAGCYAIQHRASQFIRSIEGSPSGVIGLPVEAIVGDLERMGVPARPRP